MADLAHVTVNDNDLIGDTDATHWAERFAVVRRNLLTGPEHRDIAGEEGAMLAWFAGAIETGRMAGYEQGRDAEAAGEPGLTRIPSDEGIYKIVTWCAMVRHWRA